MKTSLANCATRNLHSLILFAVAQTSSRSSWCVTATIPSRSPKPWSLLHVSGTCICQSPITWSAPRSFVTVSDTIDPCYNISRNKTELFHDTCFDNLPRRPASNITKIQAEILLELFLCHRRRERDFVPEAVVPDHLRWVLGACADKICRVREALDVEILDFVDAEGNGRT